MPRKSEIQAEEAMTGSPLRRSTRKNLVNTATPTRNIASKISSIQNEAAGNTPKSRRASLSQENGEKNEQVERKPATRGRRASTSKEETNLKPEPAKPKGRRSSATSDHVTEDPKTLTQNKQSNTVEDPPEAANPVRTRRNSATDKCTDEEPPKRVTRSRRNSAQEEEPLKEEPAKRTTRRRKSSVDTAEEVKPELIEKKPATRGRKSSVDKAETDGSGTPVRGKRRLSVTENAVNLDPIEEQEAEVKGRNSSSPVIKEGVVNLTPIKLKKVEETKQNLNLSVINETSLSEDDPGTPRKSPRLTNKITSEEKVANQEGGKNIVKMLTMESEKPEEIPKTSVEIPISSEQISTTSEEIPKIGKETQEKKKTPKKLDFAKEEHVKPVEKDNKTEEMEKETANLPEVKRSEEDEDILLQSPETSLLDSKALEIEENEDILLREFPETSISEEKPSENDKNNSTETSEAILKLNESTSSTHKEKSEEKEDLNLSKCSNSSDKENMDFNTLPSSINAKKTLVEQKKPLLDTLDAATNEKPNQVQEVIVARVSNVFRPNLKDYSFQEPMEVDELSMLEPEQTTPKDSALANLAKSSEKPEKVEKPVNKHLRKESLVDEENDSVEESFNLQLSQDEEETEDAAKKISVVEFEETKAAEEAKEERIKETENSIIVIELNNSRTNEENISMEEMKEPLSEIESQMEVKSENRSRSPSFLSLDIDNIDNKHKLTNRRSKSPKRSLSKQLEVSQSPVAPKNSNEEPKTETTSLQINHPRDQEETKTTTEELKPDSCDQVAKQHISLDDSNLEEKTTLAESTTTEPIKTVKSKPPLSPKSIIKDVEEAEVRIRRSTSPSVQKQTEVVPSIDKESFNVLPVKPRAQKNSKQPDEPVKKQEAQAEETSVTQSTTSDTKKSAVLEDMVKKPEAQTEETILPIASEAKKPTEPEEPASVTEETVVLMASETQKSTYYEKTMKKSEEVANLSDSGKHEESLDDYVFDVPSEEEDSGKDLEQSTTTSEYFAATDNEIVILAKKPDVEKDLAEGKTTSLPGSENNLEESTLNQGMVEELEDDVFKEKENIEENVTYISISNDDVVIEKLKSSVEGDETLAELPARLENEENESFIVKNISHFKSKGKSTDDSEVSPRKQHHKKKIELNEESAEPEYLAKKKKKKSKRQIPEVEEESESRKESTSSVETPKKKLKHRKRRSTEKVQDTVKSRKMEKLKHSQSSEEETVKKKKSESKEDDSKDGAKDSKKSRIILEESIETKLDEYLFRKPVEKNQAAINEEESDIEEPNEFVQTMAEEGEEDTPSEDSNAIIDEGESINSTDSEYGSVSEDYDMDDSFICDEENVDLLSGEEYDLGDEKKKKKKSRIISVEEYDSDIIKIARKKKLSPSPKRKSRIITLSDSSDSNEDVSEVKSEETEPTNGEEVVFIEEKTDSSYTKTSDTCTGFASQSKDVSPLQNQKKRVSSITIQENITVKEIQESPLSERISKLVDTFCTKMKGEISMNLSIECSADATKEDESSQEEHLENDKVEKISTSQNDIVTDEEDVVDRKSRKLSTSFDTVHLDSKRKSKKKKRRMSKSLDSVDETEPKKKKLKKNKKVYSPKDILKGNTFGVINQLITDVKNRPRRVIKPSITMAGSWVTEIADIKPSTTSFDRKEKVTYVKGKIHPKDFRSQLLNDPSRTKRIDTKILLKKKGVHL